MLLFQLALSGAIPLLLCSFPFLSFAGLEPAGVIDLVVECLPEYVVCGLAGGFGNPPDFDAFHLE
ncbi:hypothetical protein [Glutamicibacter sp. MCAF14]|uniref:hypothetical protein n=1 Tax=Glutamicibacter sp. MCAF14 TaxID=3233043 RepID=UPI003F924958